MVWHGTAWHTPSTSASATYRIPCHDYQKDLRAYENIMVYNHRVALCHSLHHKRALVIACPVVIGRAMGHIGMALLLQMEHENGNFQRERYECLGSHKSD